MRASNLPVEHKSAVLNAMTFCKTSKTRVRARLDIRTERLAHTRSVSSGRAVRAKYSLDLAGLTK